MNSSKGFWQIIFKSKKEVWLKIINNNIHVCLIEKSSSLFKIQLFIQNYSHSRRIKECFESKNYFLWKYKGNLIINSKNINKENYFNFSFLAWHK